VTLRERVRNWGCFKEIWERVERDGT